MSGTVEQKAMEYIAKHGMLSRLDLAVALEIIGGYAAHFEDPQAALERLTLHDRMELQTRIERRMSFREKNREGTA